MCNENEQPKQSLDKIIQTNSQALQIPVEIYKKIMKTSIDEGLQDIVDLQNAIQEANFDTIENFSHKIKGTFSNLKLDSVSSPATEINALSKELSQLEKINELFPQLKEAFENIKQLIQ